MQFCYVGYTKRAIQSYNLAKAS